MYLFIPKWVLYLVVGGWILIGICAFYIHQMMHDYEQMRKKQRDITYRLKEIDEWLCCSDIPEEDWADEVERRRQFREDSEPEVPPIYHII